ncbi:hypothetical protein CPJCM30710_20260 [Clostridium polyendosporum]|uniref:Uncharacterized protein n=1 Tax=Clostridium polyendosporum TaxID=69208 RepID=A0A919RZD4_9CLOT|nr:hypothetical protein [Clostridium polyendosporum]GIM29360.1 hypothetical protein CPJCM30710_20260 [Clostridium polyendosporum]
MRGRKKQEDAFRVNITFRINEKQSELLKNNRFMYKDLQNHIRQYLDSFLIKNNEKK